jgi:hypothetical protein
MTAYSDLNESRTVSEPVAVTTVTSACGAPRLSISLTNSNLLVIAWPAPAAGWVLEVTNALPSAAVESWPQVPQPYQTAAGTIWVGLTNNPATGNQFYRLHRP